MGVGVIKFYVKVFYVMSKALPGKLCCVGAGLVRYWNRHSLENSADLNQTAPVPSASFTPMTALKIGSKG